MEMPFRVAAEILDCGLWGKENLYECSNEGRL